LQSNAKIPSSKSKADDVVRRDNDFRRRYKNQLDLICSNGECFYPRKGCKVTKAIDTY